MSVHRLGDPAVARNTIIGEGKDMPRSGAGMDRRGLGDDQTRTTRGTSFMVNNHVVTRSARFQHESHVTGRENPVLDLNWAEPERLEQVRETGTHR